MTLIMTTIHPPEYHNHEEYQRRCKRLQEIQELGMDPYPPTFVIEGTLGTLTAAWEGKELGHSEDAALGKTPPARIAGRLVLFRPMGKNAFGQLQDESGRMQIMFHRDSTQVTGLNSPELPPLKFLEKKIDLGDFLGCEGFLFRTQKGELTLFVTQVTLLCKTLLPLPDKHGGVADKGVRYRKRWLDLISHVNVIEIFRLRSKILQLTRQFFDREGFLEVETPVLQTAYGGASAQPFKTHLNALHQDMFMRISLEIPLKKLIVGGFLKVFEMGKVFRNEGIDRSHNPEFTEIEAYAAYWDYNDMMSMTERLFESIALALFGKTQFTVDYEHGSHTIDVKAPWKRLSMKESLQCYAQIDVDTMNVEEMRGFLLKKGAAREEIEHASRGLLIAALFEECVEEHLIQPHHIIDHPIETTPLCKLHRDPTLRKEKFVERFESFILGTEFCNSYTELNDPILQRSLLEAQSQGRDQEEAPPMDEEFVEAICQGMPPTGGWGMGIDRFVMLFANAHSIRDVLFFPLMKQEE